MNAAWTTLVIRPWKKSKNQLFRVFFGVDSRLKEINVGQTYTVISVNRRTGEVQFAAQPTDDKLPPELPWEK